jgi:hypothetical protein
MMREVAMKVLDREAFPSPRRRLWSILIAGVLAILALLASPFRASSFWGMELDAGDGRGVTAFSASEGSTIENSFPDVEEVSREVEVVTGMPAASSAGDLVSQFLTMDDVTGPGVFLGMYTSASLQVSAEELGQVEAWLNANGLDTQVAIGGTFMDIEFPNPEWNIPHDLDAAWSQGTVPFVNLAVGTADLGPRTAYDVASGALDGAIRTWASIFAQWTEGGTKRAFIAPLQEMNGYWVSYGYDPENYKLAFTRIQALFAEEGVPQESVLWVFAPNGWSEAGQEFERYYPGDEVVDVVGFSAFNFGACVPSGEGWDSYEVAIEPYLERMEDMAPSKPIFLAQTGTVAEGGDKGAWLVDTFGKLAESENFRGLIYFNVSKAESGAPSCNPVDWRVYQPEAGVGEEDFIEAVRLLGGGAAEDPPSHYVFMPIVIE